MKRRWLVSFAILFISACASVIGSDPLDFSGENMGEIAPFKGGETTSGEMIGDEMTSGGQCELARSTGTTKLTPRGGTPSSAD